MSDLNQIPSSPASDSECYRRISPRVSGSPLRVQQEEDSSIHQTPAPPLPSFFNPIFGLLTSFLGLNLADTAMIGAGLIPSLSSHQTSAAALSIGYLYAIIASLTWTYYKLSQVVSEWFESSVTIDHDDILYQYLIKWLTKNISTRNLRARSRNSNGSLKDDLGLESLVIPEGGSFRYSDWQKAMPPNYEPHEGFHRITFGGRWFWVRKWHTAAMNSDPAAGVNCEKTEHITISCLGRSPEPIKQFLQETKRLYLDEENSKTQIYRPRPNYCNSWILASTRPSRPMDTVIVDEVQKNLLLNDINNFLHPASPAWYAAQGIPYRRGYLLYGPPGTGKSSLTFALGGKVGLGIYVLSLTAPGLNDDYLSTYFLSLPRRCIVLIEDVDTVAISRKRVDGIEVIQEQGGKNQGISLSGVLNAIDGVASQEGRILVMTTNHPELLDSALIRPGRIDLQIGFKLASTLQIARFFENMFSCNHLNIAEDDEKIEKIKAAAELFAARLPQNTFSPAEIQGFLLVRRDNYKKALDEVEAWRDEMLAKKGGNE